MTSGIYLGNNEIVHEVKEFRLLEYKTTKVVQIRASDYLQELKAKYGDDIHLHLSKVTHSISSHKGKMCNKKGREVDGEYFTEEPLLTEKYYKMDELSWFEIIFRDAEK